MNTEITDESRLIYRILVDYAKPVPINRLSASADMPRVWLERHMEPLLYLGLVTRWRDEYTAEPEETVPALGRETMRRRLTEGQQFAPLTPPVRQPDLQIYRIVEREGRVPEREVPTQVHHSRYSLRAPITRLVSEGYIRRSAWATSGAVTLETPEAAIARENGTVAQALKVLTNFDEEVAKGLRYASGRLRPRRSTLRQEDPRAALRFVGWMDPMKFQYWMHEMAHADSPQPYGEPLGGL